MNIRHIKINRLLYFFLLFFLFGSIIYLPALKGALLNWDDNIYITSNELVTAPILSQFNKIFTTTFEGHYHPLVLISLSIDHKISSGEAWPFHLTNILLHILNSFLVFLLLRRIFKEDVTAFLAALLFCVHPVQVEAVAWITARKDVLFAFFLLLSLIQYQKYLLGRKPAHYLLALLFFLLSCLSKGQAIVLPFILLSLDWYYNKSLLNRRTVIEKLPFFLLSLIFGYLIVYAQAVSGYTSDIQPGFLDTLLYSSYAFITYIQKIILPVGLSAYYPYPYAANGHADPLLWFYVAALIFFLFLLYMAYKRSKIICLSMLFFFFNIVLMLKYVPVANFIVAERYAYLASIGILMIFSYFVVYLLKRYKAYQKIIYGILLLLVVSLGVAAHQRTKIWTDSLSLLNDILKKHPDVVTALNSRGDIFISLGNFEAAEKDFSKAIAVRPQKARAYRNRGMLYLRSGSYSKAAEDFSKVLEMKGQDAISLLYRGMAYENMRRPAEALSDYNLAIELDPDAAIAYNTRGIFFSKSGSIGMAISDFDKSIQLDPLHWQTHFNRGMANVKDSSYLQALSDFNTCLNNGFDHPAVHLYRGIANFHINNYNGALKDLNVVVAHSAEEPLAWEYLGYISSAQHNFARAAEYFDHALQLQAANPRMYYERGLARVRSGKGQTGCQDLEASLRLGYVDATDTIKKYCTP